MAQYGKQKYGTSYYGLTSVRSGPYLSEVYNIGSNVVEDVQIALNMSLPKVVYYPTTANFEGTWGKHTVTLPSASGEEYYNGYLTTDYDSKYLFAGACRNVFITFISRNRSDSALISIKKNGAAQPDIVIPIL